METNEIKILLGNSIEPLEIDVEDSIESKEFPYQEDAIQDYYFSIIINSIGNMDFQENYLGVKNKLKTYTTKEQLRLVSYIINKINKVYEFEIPNHLFPDNQEDTNQLLEFLEFLEYDHEKFITEIWYHLNTTNEKNFNITEISKEKSKQILLEIEEQLESQYFSELTSYFLRTYNKEKLIDWFIEKSTMIKTLILLTTRKE